MNTQFGGGAGPAGSVETGLQAWLRGFEPGPMPVAARLRISADLGKLEARPSRSMLSMARGMSSIAASVFLVVLSALVLLGAMGARLGGAVGSAGSVWPGQAAYPPVATGPSGSLDHPTIALLLLAVSAVVGAGVYLRPVRRLARLLVGGEDPAADGLLPRPRHLRDVPIRTRVLAILPAALVVWYVTEYPHPTLIDTEVLVTSFMPATFAFAIALRYPVRDHATRLMLAGGLALLAQPLIGLIWQVANLLGLSDALAISPLFLGLQITQSVLVAAGFAALAAGLVGRSGIAARPPLALCAAVAGTTFLFAAANFLDLARGRDLLSNPHTGLLSLLASVASSWINVMAWMMILWVGASAGRRPGSAPAWRIVFAGGAALATMYVLGEASYWLSRVGIGWAPDFSVWLIAEGLVLAGLLLALLVGLRPVQPAAVALLSDLQSAALPVEAHVRVSPGKRVLDTHPARAWTRLPRLVSTAVSVAVVLAWAVLFLLAVTSMNTASYGPGAPTGPEPIINPPTTDLGSPQWLADPLSLVLILVASVLAGAAVNLRLVRSAAHRVVFGSGEAVAAAPIPMRRRLRSVPRLALVLAMLPVINVVMQPYLYHPLMLAYSVSLFLPSALACVIAFRYPVSDRSVRWLLVGGASLGIAVSMHLDTYWTLRAIGWLALAVGLAARAGVANRPPWLVVAAAVGAVLYVEAGSVINIAALYTPVDYVLPELIYQAATECLITFAWMAIIWTAFTCLRRGGGLVWVLVLAAATGLLGLQLYQALGTNIDTTIWVLNWVDHETLTNALLAVEWLSFGALLAALLIGLGPATPALPVTSEGMPQPDPGTRRDIATP